MPYYPKPWSQMLKELRELREAPAGGETNVLAVLENPGGDEAALRAALQSLLRNFQLTESVAEDEDGLAIEFGAGPGGETFGHGGEAILRGGDGAVSGNGGPASVVGGTGGSQGNGGNASVEGGMSSGVNGYGGHVLITGGTGVGTGNGGNLTIQPGAPAGSGDNGYLIIQNIPTSDPDFAGALWNDSGTLKISAG